MSAKMVATGETLREYEEITPFLAEVCTARDDITVFDASRNYLVAGTRKNRLIVWQRKLPHPEIAIYDLTVNSEAQIALLRVDEIPMCRIAVAFSNRDLRIYERRAEAEIYGVSSSIESAFRERRVQRHAADEFEVSCCAFMRDNLFVGLRSVCIGRVLQVLLNHTQHYNDELSVREFVAVGSNVHDMVVHEFEGRQLLLVTTFADNQIIELEHERTGEESESSWFIAKSTTRIGKKPRKAGDFRVCATADSVYVLRGALRLCTAQLDGTIRQTVVYKTEDLAKLPRIKLKAKAASRAANTPAGSSLTLSLSLANIDTTQASSTASEPPTSSASSQLDAEAEWTNVYTFGDLLVAHGKANLAILSRASAELRSVLIAPVKSACCINDDELFVLLGSQPDALVPLKSGTRAATSWRLVRLAARHSPDFAYALSLLRAARRNSPQQRPAAIVLNQRPVEEARQESVPSFLPSVNPQLVPELQLQLQSEPISAPAATSYPAGERRKTDEALREPVDKLDAFFGKMGTKLKRLARELETELVVARRDDSDVSNQESTLPNSANVTPALGYNAYSTSALSATGSDTNGAARVETIDALDLETHGGFARTPSRAPPPRRESADGVARDDNSVALTVSQLTLVTEDVALADANAITTAAGASPSTPNSPPMTSGLLFVNVKRRRHRVRHLVVRDVPLDDAEPEPELEAEPSDVERPSDVQLKRVESAPECASLPFNTGTLALGHGAAFRANIHSHLPTFDDASPDKEYQYGRDSYADSSTPTFSHSLLTPASAPVLIDPTLREQFVSASTDSRHSFGSGAIGLEMFLSDRPDETLEETQVQDVPPPEDIAPVNAVFTEEYEDEAQTQSSDMPASIDPIIRSQNQSLEMVAGAVETETADDTARRSIATSVHSSSEAQQTSNAVNWEFNSQSGREQSTELPAQQQQEPIISLFTSQTLTADSGSLSTQRSSDSVSEPAGEVSHSNVSTSRESIISRAHWVPFPSPSDANIVSICVHSELLYAICIPTDAFRDSSAKAIGMHSNVYVTKLRHGELVSWESLAINLTVGGTSRRQPDARYVTVRQLCVSTAGDFAWALTFGGTTHASFNLMHEGMAVGPQTTWIAVQSGVRYIALDTDAAWYVRNGDVAMQGGLTTLSPSNPLGSKQVASPSQVHLQFDSVAARHGVVLALTVTGQLVARIGITPSRAEGTDWQFVPGLLNEDGLPLRLVAVCIDNSQPSTRNCVWLLDDRNCLFVKLGVTNTNPTGTDDTLWAVPGLLEAAVKHSVLGTWRPTAAQPVSRLQRPPKPLERLGIAKKTEIQPKAPPTPSNLQVCGNLLLARVSRCPMLLSCAVDQLTVHSWKLRVPPGMSHTSINWQALAICSFTNGVALWLQHANGEVFCYDVRSRVIRSLSVLQRFACVAASPDCVWCLLEHSSERSERENPLTQIQKGLNDGWQTLNQGINTLNAGINNTLNDSLSGVAQTLSRGIPVPFIKTTLFRKSPTMQPTPTVPSAPSDLEHTEWQPDSKQVSVNRPTAGTNRRRTISRSEIAPTVYIRSGVCSAAPHGVSWRPMAIEQLQSHNLVHISLGTHTAWCVDSCGRLFMRFGVRWWRSPDLSLEPAWLPVDLDGLPPRTDMPALADGSAIVRVYVNVDDDLVWCVSAGGEVYARAELGRAAPLGTRWTRLDAAGSLRVRSLALGRNDAYALDAEGRVYRRVGMRYYDPLSDGDSHASPKRGDPTNLAHYQTAIHDFDKHGWSVGTHWELLISPRLKAIVCSPDGHVFGLSRSGQLFEHDFCRPFVPSPAQSTSVSNGSTSLDAADNAHETNSASNPGAGSNTSIISADDAMLSFYM